MTERIPLAVVAAAGVVFGLGLFARIMAYPLGHDEHMYVPSGALFSEGSLYRDFGYNHVPNLPLLLHLVFSVSGTEHFLLVGRIVTFVAWLAAGLALYLLAIRSCGTWGMATFMVFLMLTNPVLLEQTGMLASNNFIPIPFALFGLYCFLVGTEQSRGRPPLLALSGFSLALAAGFKVSYAAAILPFAGFAFFVPRQLPFVERLRRVVLPLAAGGFLGALPTLSYVVGDLDAFLAHTVRYHTGPHVAYWTAHANDGAVALSAGAKLLLAHMLWLSSPTAVVLLTTLFMVMLVAVTDGALAGLRRFATWRVALVLVLVALAIVVSFVPTPAFPQYFAPPIVFGIALIALCYSRLDQRQRVMIPPFMYAVVLFLLLSSGPRLFQDFPKLLTPESWTALKVHSIAERIAAQVGPHEGPARLATLSPLYALEAGLGVYPELAAGPFVYRVADLIPEHDQIYYRLASPSTLADLLDAEPPVAILVGFEDDLDQAFSRYASSRGYQTLDEPFGQDRYGAGVLHLRLSASRAAETNAAHSAHR